MTTKLMSFKAAAKDLLKRAGGPMTADRQEAEAGSMRSGGQARSYHIGK